MTRAYARHSRSQRSVASRVVLPLVRGEAAKRPGSLVVELGCGPGTLLAALAPLAPLGLDADALGVALARKAGLKARRADFRRIPDELKGRFGVVYSNEALHWMPPPPARFVRASWSYRFLPRSERSAFDAWGEARFTEGLRGAARLLAPGGTAVLQFGGRGQLLALFEAFDWALKDPAFDRYRGCLWNPTFYPAPRRLPGLLAKAGLKKVRLRAWSERLTENTPAAVVAFVRAFTERTLLAPLRPAQRELFYERLGQRLLTTGLRRIRWQRTLVVARKA